MRAISLRTLLLLVACVGLALVVLIRPSLFWTRLSFSMALVFIGWWFVLAVAGRGDRRRFGIAAAICGLGYFYVALLSGQGSTTFGPNAREGYVTGRTLITHQALETLSPWIGHQFQTQINDLSLWDTSMFATMSYVPVTPPPAPPNPGVATTGLPAGNESAAEDVEETGDEEGAVEATVVPAPVPAFGGGMGGGGFGGGGFSPGGMGGFGGGGGFAGPVAWRAVPGASPAARYQYYLISGHCLFAILIGLSAGAAARKLLRSDDVVA